MNVENQKNTRFYSLLAICMVAMTSGLAQAQWTGWGGPNRDFKSDSKGLANQWPEDGPRKLWSRDLGEGYSSLAVDAGRIYTMYRSGDEEIVVSLNAENGETDWEYRFISIVAKADKKGKDKKGKGRKGKDKEKSKPAFSTRFGTGPNSTPLIHNGKVYALSINGVMLCLDQKTGKKIWSQDLVKDHRAEYPGFGFSSSPIAYKNTLIAAVGGKSSGMMAFDLNSGSVIWKKNNFQDIYSSPIMINVDGQDQVVLLTDRKVVGINPSSGNVYWQHKHENQYKTNISTPVWDSSGLLYVSSGGEAGSRGLKLTRKGKKTRVEEVWANKKMGIGQGNVVRVGDYIYGCAGGQQGAFMTAINAKTGEIAWRERGYKKSMMIHVDGKLIILDEDGTLSLAKANPKEFKVLSTVELLKNKSWSIPAVVGKTLFLRDKKTIMALDIG